MKLYYLEPANKDNWNEALPIGNGSIGAMIFGGVQKEHVQINEETVLDKGTKNMNNKDAHKYLPVIRKVLLNRKVKKTETLTSMVTRATPYDERYYETLGDIFIDFKDQNGSAEDYKRELNLNNSMVKIRYRINGVEYLREMFPSAVNKVMVIHFTANKTGSISFISSLKTKRCYDYVSSKREDTIELKGKSEKGIDFCSFIKVVLKGGKISNDENRFIVEKADEVTLFINARTDFWGDDPEEWCLNNIERASATSYKKLRRDHLNHCQKFLKNEESIFI